MADRNHLRLAGPNDPANDDPFAELTRIMGFDPRQSAKPAPASEPVEAEAVDAGFDEADFDIDLERELMGAFADEGPTASPTADADPVLASADDVAHEAAVAHDDDLNFDDDWFHADEAEPSLAMAEAKQDPRAIEDEAPGGDVFAGTDHVPEVFETEPAYAEAPAHADDATLDSDAAQAEAVTAAVDDSARETAESDLDGVFEDALADVDTRFDAPRDAAAAPEAAVVPETVVDLDHELDLSLRADFETTDEVDDPLEDDDLPSHLDTSLEDELNALLGNRLTHHDSAALVQPFVSHPAAPVAGPVAADLSAPAALDAVSEAEHVPAATGAYGWDDTDGTPAHAVEADEVPTLSDEGDAYSYETPAYADEAEDVQPISNEADAYAREAVAEAGETLNEPEFDVPELDASEFDVPELDDLELDASEFEASDDDARDSVPAGADLDADDGSYDPNADTLYPATVDLPRYPAYGSYARPASPATLRTEQAVANDGYDPYAALSALSASLKTASRPAVQETPVDEWHEPDASLAHAAAPAATRTPVLHDDYVPDVETVDVPEHAIALADDLDLPEFTYDNEPTAAPTYDDIDAEFTSLLNEMNADADQPAGSQSNRYDDYDADFRRPEPRRDAYAVPAGVHPEASFVQAAAAATAFAAAKPVEQAGPAVAKSTTDDPIDTMVDQEFADMEFAYDPDLDEEMALPAYAAIERRPAPRRGMMIAAVVGGVALLGGIGAFALSFGNGIGSGEPVLVKADNTPVKVKPENPGGTTIPNQDNKVYDTVGGAKDDSAPTQEKLVTTAEEPVEMPAPALAPLDGADDEAEAAGAAPDTTAADTMDTAVAKEVGAQPSGQKAEDRIEQIADEAGVDKSVEVAAVAPRKVRTMIVKADGTLVAREDPTPAAAQPTGTASSEIVEPAAAAPTTGTITPPAETEIAGLPAESAPLGAAPAIDEPAAAAPTPATPTAAPAAEAPAAAAPAPAQSSTTPARVPVAPARPSDQPLDIVGEVKGDKVAALGNAAAAPGSWAMQIASQPTEAAAQSTYQALARRYGAVLDGRQATIVKADITGKGTFWRVRIAANSRNEAVSLCENYKSAGGNCFVSK